MHNLMSEDVLLDFLQICWERQVVIWVHQNKQDPNMDYHSRLTMCRGALTVEATFVVPIFFLVFCSLLYLFQILQEQRQIQEQLVTVAERYESLGIRTPILQTDRGDKWLVNWKISGDSGTCECIWRKSVPMIGEWFQITLYQRMPLHNYSGHSMISTDRAADSCVYLARNGTVYHLRLDCTYLKLGIRQVTGKLVEKERNRSGGKYKACELCADGQQLTAQMQWYITPYGDRYHKEKDCAGLRRSIRKLKKSQVGDLPACSKCGRE